MRVAYTSKGEYERGFEGELPQENCTAGEAFLSMFWSKFKFFLCNGLFLFQIILVLYPKKDKCQELTKYLIHDCGYSLIMQACMLVNGLQAELYLTQGESLAQHLSPG